MFSNDFVSSSTSGLITGCCAITVKAGNVKLGAGNKYFLDLWITMLKETDQSVSIVCTPKRVIDQFLHLQVCYQNLHSNKCTYAESM